jgi:hypothetical protein
MPLPLYPWGKNPGTHWIEGWLGPRAGQNKMEKRKFLTLPGLEPITVAAWSKVLTVFARSNTEIVCSNPTQGMDVCIVCVYSVFMLFCVQAEALQRADPPSEESYRLCIGSRN